MRSIEWLSSISAAKIMDEKLKIGENFCTNKPQPGAEYTPFVYGQHSPEDRAKELFKSALNRERLVV